MRENIPQDIPLASDQANYLLPWIVGFMTFMATLMFTGGMIVGNISHIWQNDLTGKITIVINANADVLAPDEKQARKQQNQLLIAELKLLPEIIDARIIEQDELQKLLVPWFGEAARSDGLPLPTLIDVNMSKINPENLETVRGLLRRLNGEAVLDDHNLWRQKLVRIAIAFQFVAYLSIMVVIFTAIVMIIFAVHSAMSSHAEIIDMIHLFGAEDSYMVKQFLNYIVTITWRGVLVGFIMALIIIITIRLIAGQAIGQLLPSYILNIWQWPVLLILPIIFVILAMLTTRITVVAKLSKLSPS